jgi:sulfur-oxidizing protein SoxA
VSHGEQPLKYKKGDIAKISAYLALHSRGEIIDVEVSGEAAINAYEQGKKYYYSKRGQLNFACVDCHVASSGMRIRAEILSPSLGHVSNFPVYRFKWGSIGTLHRRFSGCNSQVRAKPLPGQSEEYKNLEYFLSYMSNGLKFNGPSTRR